MSMPKYTRIKKAKLYVVKRDWNKNNLTTYKTQWSNSWINSDMHADRICSPPQMNTASVTWFGLENTVWYLMGENLISKLFTLTWNLHVIVQFSKSMYVPNFIYNIVLPIIFYFKWTFVVHLACMVGSGLGKLWRRIVIFTEKVNKLKLFEMY